LLNLLAAISLLQTANVILCEAQDRMRLLEALLRDSLRSNIGPQNLRNHHTSIGLLIILNDRDPGAANGESAAVQSMYEFGLIFPFRAIPDVRPPRLVRLKIRAGRNLPIQLLAGQPNLNILRLR
jgi:hypothetical protein